MNLTTNIFGYNFICDTSYEQLADEIIHDITNCSMGVTNFITPNAYGINMYSKYPELNRFCQSSKYILPDGQPIVWLSRLTPHHIKRRLTGSDFFPVIFHKLKSPEHTCLFVVSTELLKTKFMAKKPDASYIVPEFFEMHEHEKLDAIGDQLVKEILAKKIHYVFIGIGEPKQGALAQNVTKKLMKLSYPEPCLFFFLGASFEFYFGFKKRAPLIFQKLALEWFYRLITEPRRMYKRYIFGNIVFVMRALKWFVTKKPHSQTREL